MASAVHECPPRGGRPVERFAGGVLRTARQAYRCDRCGGAIARGKPYWRAGAKHGRDWSRGRLCHACGKAGNLDLRAFLRGERAAP